MAAIFSMFWTIFHFLEPQNDLKMVAIPVFVIPRVVARVFLVPGCICRTFTEIDHFYPKLPGF